MVCRNGSNQVAGLLLSSWCNKGSSARSLYLLSLSPCVLSSPLSLVLFFFLNDVLQNVECLKCCNSCSNDHQMYMCFSFFLLFTFRLVETLFFFFFSFCTSLCCIHTHTHTHTERNHNVIGLHLNCFSPFSVVRNIKKESVRRWEKKKEVKNACWRGISMQSTLRCERTAQPQGREIPGEKRGKTKSKIGDVTTVWCIF